MFTHGRFSYILIAMVIVGVTGTLGAGKGEIVKTLEKKGFAHFSARDFLTEELVRRGQPINRIVMTDLADELRRTHSPGYIIERLYEMALKKGQNSVIESVRALGELDFLRKQSKENPANPFYLIAVDADRKIRYQRIVARGSWLDHVSFDRFVADEIRELNSTDPTRGNIAECVRRADFTVMNNGSREDIAKQVADILKKVLK